MKLASVDERGTLEQISFALLLIRALDRRWTGTLLLGADGEDQHVLEIDRGLICRVLVPDAYARLGRLMVEAGVVREPELDKALARDDLLIGRAIVEAGHIDDKTLERALVLQLLKRLERLFGSPLSTPWAFGSDQSAFEGMPESVRIDTLRVLWAGLTAHGEMGPWLDASLERIGKTSFRVRHDVNLRRFGFTADARKLVRVIRDERVDLDELVARGIAPEEVCRQIVYLLAVTRYLDFSQSGTASESKPPVRASESVDDMPSISDESSTENSTEDSTEDTVPPAADSSESAASSGSRLQRAPRRVAKIALRRVTVSRQPAAAPDPPGSGEPSSSRGKRQKEGGGRVDLVSDLEGRLVRLDDETPFENIGLDPRKIVGKDDDTITGLLWHAYVKVAKRWHPDNCPEDHPELREGMAKIHEAASEAFALLSDPETRELFLADEDLSGTPPPSSRQGESEPDVEPDSGEGDTAPASARELETKAPAPVTLPSAGNEPPADEEEEPISGERAVEMVMMSPSDLHARALMALSEDRLDEALRLVKAACKAEPDDPDFLASSSWIQAAQAKPKLNVILMDLDDLLESHPSHVSGRYYRGVLRRRVGNAEGAREDFEAVLHAEPNHAGAEEELATLKKASPG